MHQYREIKTNLENSDKLLVVAQRRFELGTVTREELLDLRLANNNARSVYRNGRCIRGRQKSVELLMLPLDIELDIVIPDELPVHEVDPQLVLQKALKTIEMLELELNILQQQSNVDRANRARHFRLM